MVLQNIPHDYIATLPEKKPTRVGVYRKDVVTGVPVPSFIVIPPLNANLDISTLARFDPKVHTAMVMAPSTTAVPEKYKDHFNWLVDRRDNQSVDMTKQITKVGNQHACGCCWAFSSADAVSDVFVVSGKAKTNPRCSVTYALACYPHCKDFGNPATCTGDTSAQYPYSYQCNGGAIAPLLQWIGTHGIASLTCESFDWCVKNKGCTEGRMDTTALNYTIPPCGCSEKNSSTNKDRYFISTPISKGLSSSKPSETEINDHIRTMKHWIYNYGTVVTGFFVYENLMTGQFKHPQKNPEGIYLEDVNYHDMELFGNQTNAFQGGHAVCVIGWGVGAVANALIADRALRNPKGEMTMVPYWLVRNSWSQAWGQDGLFKMAMYPFNKIAQFDKYVSINTPQGRGEAGGMVIFMADRVASSSSNPISRLLQAGTSLLSTDTPSDGSTTSGMFSWWYLFVIIVIVILLVTMIMWIRRK